MSGDVPSVVARDELAGIVERFGVLTRSELSDGLSELAFKRGEEVDTEAVDAAVSMALAEYVLVPAPADAVLGELEGLDDEPSSDRSGRSAPTGALAVGPAAFPTPPPDVDALPHILSIPDREVDHEAVAVATLDRFHDEVDAALVADDDERLAVLLEVSYDLEAWAAVDVGEVRERIVSTIEP